MSDLISQIRAAQVRAAEDVVVANLQSMGLAQPPRAERDAHAAFRASMAAQAYAKASNAEPCFCTGPKDGAPLCPCGMRHVRVVDGRYIQTLDLGPAPLDLCRSSKPSVFSIPPEAAAIGAVLDGESLEQGDPSCI